MFTKRRHGLYSKASRHCLLTGSQIVIIATPSSSHSNVSLYSFGHSSVDATVSAYLSGQSPALVQEMRQDLGVFLAWKELGLGFWWEDEGLAISKDPKEIHDAIKSTNSLLSHARKFLVEEEVGNLSQLEVVAVIDEMNDQRDLYEWSSMDVDELLHDLPEEDDHHQVVATCEKFCNSNASLPVGDLLDDLDFQR